FVASCVDEPSMAQRSGAGDGAGSRGICASGSGAPRERPGTAAREPPAAPRAIAPATARTGDPASPRAPQFSPPPAPAAPSPGGHQAGQVVEGALPTLAV